VSRKDFIFTFGYGAAFGLALMNLLVLAIGGCN
jgi:hypothetical protein